MELMLNIIVYGTLMGMFIATISALIYFLIKINQRDEEDKGWCIGEEPHEDYPKCSYCTCPNNCILVDKPKAESEE